MASPPVTENIWSRRLVYSLFFLFFVANSIAVSFLEPFPAALDELAHYSYVRHANSERMIFTQYEKSYLLEPDHGMSAWSETNNYLSHPSFYYLSLGLLLDVTGKNPEEEIFSLRIANLIISACAVLLLFVLGANIFSTLPSHVLYAAAIACFPKLAVVGGIINNDNLTVLGAALAFLGTVRFLEGQCRNDTALLTGSGFALAALAKLTAGLSIGLMILFTHVVRCRQDRHVIRDCKPYLMIVVTFALVGIMPYFVNLLTIGSPIYINESAYALPYLNHSLDLGTSEYIRHFFTRMVERWAAYEPSNFFQMTSFLIMIALAIAGMLLSLSGRAVGRTRRILILSSMGATFILLLFHLYHLHGMYEKTGHLGGATVRYYIPVWPAIAMSATIGLEAIPAGRLRSYSLLMLLILLTSSTALFAHVWHALAT